MRLDAWTFSAHLAWQNAWLRWSTIATLAIVTVGTGFFLLKIVPLNRSEAIVFHYNLYFGIDNERAWIWALALPAAWIALTLLDLTFAFGLYRADPQFATSLNALALLWSLPWAFALYYLTLANS